MSALGFRHGLSREGAPDHRFRYLVASLVLSAAFVTGAASQLRGDCGLFTDVTFFCSPILELYYLGITSGTSPTTFAPDQTATRGEIAAFLARSFNQTARRASRRAALGQWWTPKNERALGVTGVGGASGACASDGADIWVASDDGSVTRVRASDGKTMETWTGATQASAVLSAIGQIFVSGGSNPGRLFLIDPRLPAGPVTTVAENLGAGPNAIAFDGSRIWTANFGGSISIVTPGATLPWSVVTVATGFTKPVGMLYDGANIWVTEFEAGTLLRLDADGNILQTVTVVSGPEHPVFDGANIWVPSVTESSMSVVRASNGAVLATLKNNGLLASLTAGFDGERILVTNQTGSSVSLWRAADLTPIGSVSTGAGTIPGGSCSDGLNFWITMRQPSQVVRF